MKISVKLIKSFAIILLLFAIILFTAPFIFKNKLVELAKTEINKNVNAKVDFGNFSLSFFSAFPNLNFVIHDLVIMGDKDFEGKSLAQIDKLEIRVGLLSLNSDQFSIKSIKIDQPKFEFLALKNGNANWNIAKNAESHISASQTSSSFNLLLEHIFIKDGSFIYEDRSTGIKTQINEFWGLISGDINADITSLKTEIISKDFNFSQGEIKYMDHSVLSVNGEFESNFIESKYTFSQIETKLNELGFTLHGMIEMPTDDIKLNLHFEAKENEFKNFLSVIPSLYNHHFKNLHASGLMSLTANVNGVFKQGQLPAFDLKLKVKDGQFNYADMPASVQEVSIGLNVTKPAGKMDRAEIDLHNFHLMFENDPIDARLKIQNPISDPEISGMLKGTLNLHNFKNIFPLEDVELNGIVTSDIELNGRMSAIQKGQFSNFVAIGELKAMDILYSSKELPNSFTINKAVLKLKPQQLDLKTFDAQFGKSDFQLNGKFDNYIAYALSDEDLIGSFNLQSSFIDLDELLSSNKNDGNVNQDSSSITFEVPNNIDFVLRSQINKALYRKAEIENIRGDIIIKDAKVEIKNMNLHMLDGDLKMAGSYETPIDSKPEVGFGFNIENFEVAKTANTFKTLKLLAPIIEKCSGNFSASIIYYNCLLNKNMMPDLKTINARGSFSSKNLKLNDSEIINKLGGLLKLGDLKTLALNDIDLSFAIENGRLEVKPFEANIRNIKTTIQGVQTTDQNIDYLINFSLPKSALGDASLALNNLLSKAENSGLNINTSDFLSVNAKITGHITKPQIDLGVGKSDVTIKDKAIKNVDKAKQEALNKTQKQADEILNRATEKANKIKNSAKVAADKIRAETEIQAKKIEDAAKGQMKILQTAAQKTADKLRLEGEKKAQKVEDEAATKAKLLLLKAHEEIQKIK